MSVQDPVAAGLQQAQEPAAAASAAAASAAATPGAAAEFLHQLELLGWIDRTALTVLLIFFVIGLFKGLFWATSRVVILVIAYGIAGRFGGAVGHWLGHDVPAPTGDQDAAIANESSLYLAYVLVFVAVLIVLSLVAVQVQKLVKRAGLGLFDRVGGGVLGIATGASAVLFLLFVVNMFFRDSSLCSAAEASHSMRLSRQAIDWLGARVPDELRSAMALAPLQSPKAPQVQGPGQGDDEGPRQPDAPAPDSQGERHR